jgi:UDP-N-acetylmuramate dehydrogenase
LSALHSKLRSAFESIAHQLQGTVEFDAPLAKVSYYRIGGPAAVLVTPKNFADLQLIYAKISEGEFRFFLLGWGSNLLFSDAGFAGVVIRMKHLFAEIEPLENNRLRVGASVGGSTLLRKAQEQGWGGLAHLTGIPGSVGGMIAMNAGTHLGEMRDGCVKVRSVNLLARAAEFEIREHTPSANDFSYRHNHFLQPGELILDAELAYTPEDPEKVKMQIDELYQRRKQTQPVDFPSCGSVFMNPREHGKHAWQVIDQLGLRGEKIGNAQIAEKHSNFIINLGGALASEVRALITLVKSRARNELGIELQEEVKFVE